MSAIHCIGFRTLVFLFLLIHLFAFNQAPFNFVRARDDDRSAVQFHRSSAPIVLLLLCYRDDRLNPRGNLETRRYDTSFHFSLFSTLQLPLRRLLGGYDSRACELSMPRYYSQWDGIYVVLCRLCWRVSGVYVSYSDNERRGDVGCPSSRLKMTRHCYRDPAGVLPRYCNITVGIPVWRIHTRAPLGHCRIRYMQLLVATRKQGCRCMSQETTEAYLPYCDTFSHSLALDSCYSNADS